MNSLYGRFGINPISSKSEIVDTSQEKGRNEYNRLLKKESFVDVYSLGNKKFLFNEKSNVQCTSEQWNPPKNSAVQIAATITAHARIYMYPFVSREDCFYSDTDSVVLGNPLPDDWISSTILGKLKLEDRIEKGVFLAPKSYFYKKLLLPEERSDRNALTISDPNETNVIKYKGACFHLTSLN